MTIHTAPKPIPKKNSEFSTFYTVSTTDRPPLFTTHSPTNTEAINLHRNHRATYIPHITYTDKDSLFIDDITPDETKQPPPCLPQDMDKLIKTRSTQLHTTTQRYRLNFKIWRWNNYNTHVKDTSKELSRIHSYYQRRRTMDHSSRHRLLPFQTCSINNSDNSFFFLSIFFIGSRKHWH